MSENVERIYHVYLADVPGDLQPVVRSLLVTRIAAHYEKSHDLALTEPAWMVNDLFLQEMLQNPDQERVFDLAERLATVPRGKDDEAEWYFRWVRGNGLTLLQEKAMRERLIGRLDDPSGGKGLALALEGFLDTDVTGFTMESLFDVPEGFSLFAALLVCKNANQPGAHGVRERLILKAMERLEDPETKRVIDLFGDIEGTRELYAKLTADFAGLPYE